MKLAAAKSSTAPTTRSDPETNRLGPKDHRLCPAAYRTARRRRSWSSRMASSKTSRNALDNLTISKDPRRSCRRSSPSRWKNGATGRQGQRARSRIRHDVRPLARFIDDEVLPAVLANAEIKAAYPKIAFTEEPVGRGEHGLQLRRRGGADHGLVPAGPVPPVDHLLRHVRRSAGRRRARGEAVSAGRLGIPLRA